MIMENKKKMCSILFSSDHTLSITPKGILFIASLVYLISNIGMLMVHGVFWDDWVIYENPLGLEQMMSRNCGSWTIPYHVFLQNLSQTICVDVTFIYRFIYFLLGWMDLFLYYYILKQLGFNNIFVFFTTIVFAAWPLGYSHMLLCCLFYQIGLLCQLIAISLFIRLINKKNIVLSVFTCIFQFLASMFLNSTIVLWFGFLCVMATVKTYNVCNFTFNYFVIWLKKMICYSIYFLPCLVYWVLRTIYWMPKGDYLKQNYNTVTFSYIIQAPINAIKALFNTFSFVLNQVSFILSSLLFFFIFLFFLCILLLSLKKKDLCFKSFNFPILIAFVFLFFCSVAAYILVGKVPEFDHVNDRFGILLALFVSPIIVSVFSLIRKNAYKLILVFVSVFCTYSLSQCFEGIRLSHRNDAIMEFFMKNNLPQGNVIVAEECPKMRSNFYSWAGLYHKATGYQDRCFECTDIGVLYDSDEYFSEEYWQKNAKSGLPTIIIYFVKEESSKSYVATFRRMLMYYLSRDEYRQMLLNDFQIRWGNLT